MKFLQDYVEKEQSKLFKECNAFFAFSNKQFEEGKKENVTYVRMGGGMFCNKEHVEKLINELDEIYNKGIQQDLEENGKRNIIVRELANHEAYYTYDIAQTVEKLEKYPITEEEIQKVFDEEKVKNRNC